LGTPSLFQGALKGSCGGTWKIVFFVSSDVIFMPSKFEASLLLLKLFWRSSSPLLQV